MFKYSILGGIAFFIGQLAYRAVQLICGVLLASFLLLTVLVLDTIRLASA
jgi:asparagine N-glycosylation enzyme membrane subunit Stt3